MDNKHVCPICGVDGGFHDRKVHDNIVVPKELTWKPGETPPWEREK